MGLATQARSSMMRPWLGLVVVLAPSAGCALYVPSIAYAPLPERAGELRVHAGYGLHGAAGGVSFAPFDGAIVLVNGETEWASTDTTSTRSRRLVGGGIGAYRRLGSSGIVEGIAGYDWGRVVTVDRHVLFQPGVEIVRRGNTTRLYGQVDLGWRKQGPVDRSRTLAASFRLASVGFSDMTETRDGEPQPVEPTGRLVVLEPGLIGAGGLGPVRAETGVRWVLPIDRHEEIDIAPLRIDFGFSVALDGLFREN
jgi:hypothetical protein